MIPHTTLIVSMTASVVGKISYQFVCDQRIIFLQQLQSVKSSVPKMILCQTLRDDSGKDRSNWLDYRPHCKGLPKKV